VNPQARVSKARLRGLKEAAMYGVYERVFVHIVWSTWDRLPQLADKEAKRAVYCCVAAKCKELSCEALDVGGIEDHVHLLAKLHRTVALADLVRNVKGSSSHLVNHEYLLESDLRWRRGYGAFSVSPNAVDTVRKYICNQASHHANNTTLIETLERTHEPSSPNEVTSAREGGLCIPEPADLPAGSWKV
jgi:putative transposase